jgi:integrase
MPASYQKVVRTSQTPKGQRVCLYVVVKDSTPVEYYITVARVRVAVFLSKDPAVQRFQAYVAGTVSVAPPPRLDDFTQAAIALENNPSKPTPHIRFALLAELERRSSLRRGTTTKHSSIPAFLATIVPNTVIPADEAGFVQWLESALNAVLQGVATMSALKVRSGTFARCLSQIAAFPIAFRSYQRAYTLAKGRLDKQRREQHKQGRPQQSRKAYSRTEIMQLLQACTTFNQASLVICYLCLGTRSGDAEHAHYSHIVNGHYNLAHVQSKTITDKRPVAPLALKLLLRYMHQEKQSFGSINTIANKLRFRPTTGVMLTLAGVDALTTSIRLGHVGMGMVVRHYVKFIPSDYGQSGSAWAYFGVAHVNIGGMQANENAYDNWLLYLLMQQAQRFGTLAVLRQLAIDELSPKSVTLSSANF